VTRVETESGEFKMTATRKLTEDSPRGSMHGSSMNGFFGRTTPRCKQGMMDSNAMLASTYTTNGVERTKKPRKITIVKDSKESGEKKRITYTLNSTKKPDVQNQ